MVDLSHTVLIIEADESTRLLYQREVSRNYQVVACSNVAEACDLINHYSFTAIILEPVFLGRPVWNFLAQLRATPPMSTIPVILCSVIDWRGRSEELGVRFCLIKPVLPNVLSNVLRQALYSPAGTK